MLRVSGRGRQARGTIPQLAHPRRLTESASAPSESADLGPDPWQGLFEHGRLQAGQSVPVHGAAGAVGSMVTQLARESGAYVIGTGRGGVAPCQVAEASVPAASRSATT